MNENKGQRCCLLLQREAQCDVATSGFLFTPKAGAAMTSKFDGVFFFSFSSFFLSIFSPSKDVEQQANGSPAGCKDSRKHGNQMSMCSFKIPC